MLTLPLLPPGFRFQVPRLLCESLSSCVLIYKVGIISSSAPLGGAEDEVRKCVEIAYSSAWVPVRTRVFLVLLSPLCNRAGELGHLHHCFVRVPETL